MLSRFGDNANSIPRVCQSGFSPQAPARRKEDLTKVLTNHRNFDQEGFRALFRDS
jgi:hypothetical protein